MEWLVVLAIGALIGFLASLISDHAHMPQTLTIFLGILGAFAGAGLTSFTGYSAMGAFTLYPMAAVVAIGFVAGGIFAFTLTGKQPSD